MCCYSPLYGHTLNDYVPQNVTGIWWATFYLKPLWHHNEMVMSPCTSCAQNDALFYANSGAGNGQSPDWKVHHI